MAAVIPSDRDERAGDLTQQLLGVFFFSRRLRKKRDDGY
jgi:hypothetical protein